MAEIFEKVLVEVMKAVGKGAAKIIVWMKKVGLSKVRFYVSGNNLFTLTGYSGYDPEVNIATGLTPNIDYDRYPRSRTYTFGAQLTF